MATYLDPKIDTLFKKIFGENKELLISFLNSLLPLQEGQEIVSIEYLSPEQVPVTALGKNSIVDVNCIDNSGRAFIVEMQTEWSNIFRKRLLVNGSKAVVKQMDKKFIEDKAKRYKDLKPVYVLAVVNGKFSKGKNWYHHLQIMDFKNPDVVIDGLDYVLLELDNFTPETWCFAHKKLAVLWLRFLKEIEGYYEKLPEEFVSNELIYSAIKLCERSSFSSNELFTYDHAETQATWDNSIRGLEDEVVESRKTIEEKEKAIVEKDKEIEELKKQLKKQ
jgi:predicted transposase/invertase (TIGR01784 family)